MGDYFGTLEFKRVKVPFLADTTQFVTCFHLMPRLQLMVKQFFEPYQFFSYTLTHNIIWIYVLNFTHNLKSNIHNYPLKKSKIESTKLNKIQQNQPKSKIQN